jgi:rfaE bifunctional protein kinase chain/domain
MRKLLSKQGLYMVKKKTSPQSTEIIKRVNDRVGSGRLIFVSGNFNIIHPGHLRLLNFARTCGDFLVVGLFKDDEPGVVLPVEIREESLLSLEAVSEVIRISQSELVGFLSQLKPYAVVKGKEHEKDTNPEKTVLKSYGGHLIFSSGEAKFSSVDLIRRELISPSGFEIKLNASFLDAHKSSVTKILKLIEKFNQVNALVVGDLIVDEYIYCDPIGMSQEDPTIVVSPVESRRFIGGAGIVAGHVASLGAKVEFLSITGEDDTALESAKILKGYGVKTSFIKDGSRPTILKQRFRASNKTLLRVSHLRTHDAGDEFVEKFLALVRRKISKSSLVIFSDFNYGCLPQNLVDGIILLCQQHGVPFVADSQASSQISDVSRYVGAKMLAATEREARLAMADFKSGIQNVANNLILKSQSDNLLLKLGAEGLIALSKEAGLHTTASLPAMNSNPVDVAGAGDAMLSAASLSMALGASLWESAYLGSIASAIQVSRTGNIPLNKENLISELKRIH